MVPEIVEAPWADIETFGSQIINELGEKPSCIIDLSNLNYIGSSLVALMVRVWKEIHQRHGRMVVVCSHRVVLDVLAMAGLDKIWTIAPSLPQAQTMLIPKPPMFSFASSHLDQDQTHSSKNGMLMYWMVAVAAVISMIVCISVYLTTSLGL